MYVKNRMAKNPITITADTTISETLDLFKDNDFHRLPVVNRDNKLIGLISEELIQANTPSKATSLSIHELNYLLSKTTVESIMLKDVPTCDPDMLLEDAADLMRRRSVSCLPVIKNDKVVGIITQKDIFAAFIDLMGTHEKGARVVVEIAEDRPGIMADIATILGDEKINISHLAVYYDDAISIVIRVQFEKGEKAAELLEAHGYKVTDVRSNL